MTNKGASTIFVPTKTNAEWTVFYTNVNANTGGNVVLSATAGKNADSNKASLAPSGGTGGAVIFIPAL